MKIHVMDARIRELSEQVLDNLDNQYTWHLDSHGVLHPYPSPSMWHVDGDGRGHVRPGPAPTWHVDGHGVAHAQPAPTCATQAALNRPHRAGKDGVAGVTEALANMVIANSARVEPPTAR